MKKDIARLSTELDNIVHRTYVTLEEFGAKGDGVTDDTIAFQKCIDYLKDKPYKHILLLNPKYIYCNRKK